MVDAVEARVVAETAAEERARRRRERKYYHPATKGFRMIRLPEKQ